jgi:hypothetical protein
MDESRLPTVLLLLLLFLSPVLLEMCQLLGIGAL